MVSKARQVGHPTIGGLWVCIILGLCPPHVFIAIPSTAQTADSISPNAQPAQPGTVQPLSARQIAELRAQAESGDVVAEMKLGQAYQNGDGVPKNDELAFKWLREAAEQGDAAAENDVGTMYRLGEGVARDKVEAFHWYEKAAHHGSAKGMFNLGTCHYNGDGVGSNEYTAYKWFLLAQDQGYAVAEEAAKRSAATMSKKETADAYLQIAEMYSKGEELSKDDAQSLRWIRKAADIDPSGKVRLAVHFLTGPEGTRDYAQALDLCKSAAKEYIPALPCVGYIYRKGLGVPQDSAEAVKWYEKGAAGLNPVAVMVMAEMYAAGEGTKVDRPAAFMLLFRAGRMGVKGANQKASELLRQLSKSEVKEVEKRLRNMRLDPGKVFEAVQSGASS